MYRITDVLAGRNCSLLALLFILVLSSCNGSCNSIEPPDWPRAEVGETNVNSAIPTEDQLVVYLDTSASMAGYISPNGKIGFAAAADGQTIFSHLLLELRHVVTTLSPSINVVFVKVATDVSQPSFNDLELSKASVDRSLYNGKETNLAGAIKGFSEPLKNANGEKTKDQRVARFHILVTDGVQSTTGQRTDTSCDKGSDFVCVKKQVVTLLEAGWNATVLGIRSEFNGTVYSEIKNGLKLEYDSTPKNINSYRPFYLYLFSQDRVELDKLVEAVKARLLPLLDNREGIREYPLTLPLTQGVAKGELTLSEKAKSYLDAKLLKGKDGEPPRFEILADLETQRANIGMQSFSIKVDLHWTNHALDAGTPLELSRLLKWDLIEVKDDKHPDNGAHRYPELKLVNNETNDQGQLELSAGWPQKTGKPAWRVYRLVARLNTEKDSPSWVANWSSDLDTTREYATRTLNLEDSFSKLWKNSAMNRLVVAEYHIRLGKN